MTPDSDFPIPDGLRVPHALRHNLNQLIRSTTRIVVSERHENEKTSKVNAIKLKCDPGQLPVEPLDEIAEAVCAIMHGFWEEQGTEDDDGPPPVEFVVMCEHYETVNGRKKRIKEQFNFTYKGDGSMFDDDSAEESRTLEDRAIQRAMDMQERQINQLIGHNDLLHNLFIKIMEKHSDSAAALGGASAETMKHALPMFFGGIQSMLNARSIEYSTAKAEAEAKASSDRLAKAFETLAPFIGIIGSQFLAHKMGVPPEAVAGLFANLGGAGRPEPPSNGAPGPGNGVGDEEIPSDLVAVFASELGRSLSNAQRRELHQRFDVAELAALDDLFCSTTDVEAVTAYNTVVQTLGARLVALQQLLEPSQMETFQGFVAALQRHAAQAQGSP